VFLFNFFAPIGKKFNSDTFDIDSLCAKARFMVQDYGMKVLFIDNLSSMHFPKMVPVYKSVEFYAEEFKALACELDIPIVVLSRIAPIDSTNLPGARDLEDYTGIARHADVVMIMHKTPAAVALTVLKNITDTRAILYLSKYHRYGLIK